MSSGAAEFEGRTALVIGATEGIGRATAMAFAASGANVFVAGLGAERGRSLEMEIRRGGRGATPSFSRPTSRVKRR